MSLDGAVALVKHDERGCQHEDWVERGSVRGVERWKSGEQSDATGLIEERDVGHGGTVEQVVDEGVEGRPGFARILPSHIDCYERRRLRDGERVCRMARRRETWDGPRAIGRLRGCVVDCCSVCDQQFVAVMRHTG